MLIQEIQQLLLVVVGLYYQVINMMEYMVLHLLISTDATAADYSMYSGIFYDAHNNQKYELTNYGSSDGGLTIISNREGNVPVIETVTLSDTTLDVTQSSKILTLDN